MQDGSTRSRLLDLAQQLAQTRGLNAFSFKDLAESVGITTASVHHHFPTKADLGRELMARYRRRFRASLEAIDRGRRSPRRKVESFSNLFRDTLRQGNRLCLCGMLATEYVTLPEVVQREVRAFYDETEAWLQDVLEEGRSTAVFHFRVPPRAVAKTFLATLEGAMIASRTFGDERRLARATAWLLASLDPASGDLTTTTRPGHGREARSARGAGSARHARHEARSLLRRGSRQSERKPR